MQNKIIQAIELGIQETKNLLKLGDDLLLSSFLTELQRYKTLVNDHWPLMLEEKNTVNIGRIAVREFDDRHPEYVTLLCHIGAVLRQEMTI
jgi:hypothetical protein